MQTAQQGPALVPEGKGGRKKEAVRSIAVPHADLHGRAALQNRGGVEEGKGFFTNEQ